MFHLFSLSLCQVLNNNAKKGGTRVVGRWAGGDAAYEPLQETFWPGGVTPGIVARVVRIMVPLPFSREWDGGKVPAAVVMNQSSCDLSSPSDSAHCDCTCIATPDCCPLAAVDEPCDSGCTRLGSR